MDKYKALIGLEMHCEISKTNTKVFSSAKNSYTEKPNVNIRPVDIAFPGTLPVVNKEAVKKALMISMVLNCKQPEYLYFERKNYYYPDLPKGYQITQETKPAPIGVYGSLNYECQGEIKTARINNLHLEEDSAGMDHFGNYSTIDYNRAGVPLLELVTEPDFKNAEEAVSFLETMRSIYQYTDTSDADSKKGQVRCDVNISIMDSNLDENDPANWGTKIEIKNVNSFSGVRDAINYEIFRQIEAKENGTYDEMQQQTRRWDEESGTTIFMRGKADAIDYKYFVEPNIPKLKIDKDWLEEIRKNIPLLASERKEKYINEYGLTNKEASILVKEKNISDYYNEMIKNGTNPKEASNWIITRVLGYINKEQIDISDIFITPLMLSKLICMLDNKEISSKQAKDIFNESLEVRKSPIDIINEKGLKQNSNDEEIRKIVTEMLSNNKDNVGKYKNGKTNLLGFFVGQVMKITKGQANPELTSNIIIEEINKI
ncbi:MAG: Asp-tRNA(Asn)/Glu-tRNA(Gln) amidotransferase subunit GatB [bacterium]|nr:Asp-tRNA(Asn)/Glu-tRNA(Gln) amidotransferase subunit GatB [bacterium]